MVSIEEAPYDEESIAGPSKPLQHSRSNLLQRSKEKGGYGDQKSRRKAWLYLLNLSHLVLHKLY